MNERDERLLEAYLDGELSTEEASDLEERLRTDLELRRALEDMRGLADQLGALPREARVPDHVWGAIRAQIAETTQDEASDVIPLASAAGRPRLARRRLTFSVPQLAAAALVLVSLGSAATWSLATRGTSPQGVAGPPGVTSVATAPEGSPVGALLAEYEESAAALEQIIEEGSSVLSEETLTVIRESLAAIDQAVEEARQALEQDPASEMLNRILLSNMQKKLDLLRSTAAAVQSMA